MPFIDKLAADGGGAREPERQPITIAAEVDRIYHGINQGAAHGGFSRPIELHDGRLGRAVTVAHQGAASAIVWNPWVDKTLRMDDMGPADAYRGMVCIETGNVPPDPIRLGPGAAHTLATRISVRKDA